MRTSCYPGVNIWHRCTPDLSEICYYLLRYANNTARFAKLGVSGLKRPIIHTFFAKGEKTRCCWYPANRRGKKGRKNRVGFFGPFFSCALLYLCHFCIMGIMSLNPLFRTCCAVSMGPNQRNSLSSPAATMIYLSRVVDFIWNWYRLTCDEESSKTKNNEGWWVTFFFRRNFGTRVSWLVCIEG